MKHGDILKKLLLINICLFRFLSAETVHMVGNYTTAGEVHGDLVVVNGDVNVTGDLVVNGDLKVTSGLVDIDSGSLRVTGDLIVTSTNSIPVYANATVSVEGDINVAGAIITKSTYGEAYVTVVDPGSGTQGSLHAARVSTNGYDDSYILTDYFITVTGSIVTRSETGDSYVKNGMGGFSGDIYAGSIHTYAPNGEGSVISLGGHLTVNGQVSTNANTSAKVRAEGNIYAKGITTRSETSSAEVSGEKIEVVGDIRTYALAGDAYVEARETALGGLSGTFEDLVANNIHTRGFSDVYVSGFRGVRVYGDIVTWQTDGIGRDVFRDAGEYPSAGAAVYGGDPVVLLGMGRSPSANKGFLEAQNVIINGVSNGNLVAENRIVVPGDIIIRGNADGSILVKSGELVAGNVFVQADSDSSIQADRILVDHVISTSSSNGNAYVLGALEITAEKIFTYGKDYSEVQASDGTITVTGPIVTKGVSDQAYVKSSGNLKAGSISTDGYVNAYVKSDAALSVREDIFTRCLEGDAYVHALSDNIEARGIHTLAFGSDNSIKAAPGSGKFQYLFGTEADYDLLIKDSEFDINSDREWDFVLSLDGTCTLNGRGHHLNFGPNGGIVVTSGSSLTLRNITLENFGGSAVRCADDTATLFLQDVTFSLSTDMIFDSGVMHVLGDLNISGTGGTSFIHTTNGISYLYSNATMFFDRGMIFSFYNAVGSPFPVNMADETSRLHFNDAVFFADSQARFLRGTLVVDNTVTLSAESGEIIYIGNGTAADNLNFEFGELSYLNLAGNIINQNA